MPVLKSALEEHSILAVLNPSGRFIFANDRFCELSQYAREDLVGQGYGLIDSGHHSGEFFRQIRRMAMRGTVWHGDIRPRARDGSCFWMAMTVVPLIEKGARPSRILVLGTDITDQKSVAAELAGKRRLQQLVSELSSRFATVQPSEVSAAIEEAQQRIVETLSLDRSTLWQVVEEGRPMIATHCWRGTDSSCALLPAPVPDTGDLSWAYGQVLRGTTISFSSLDELPAEAARDAEIFRAHGLKSNLTIPLMADRRSFGALSFTTLHKERKWTEDEVAELTMLARILGNVIGRQRAEGREEQLRRELTHAMRVATLGELAGAIAHELNQPLAAILSNAQAARRFLANGEIEPGELKAILDDVVRDDKRAGQVIHNLRAMVSKRPALRSACCLNELLREVSDLLRNELIAARIELRLRPAPGLPAVQAARVELQQVLVNLLTNAVHAMEATPPEWRILEVETRLGENGVAVAVRDHGHGIPAERLPTIFAPFFSTKATGLGLGLSICKRILENHSGRLEAGNHPERGAVFTLILPAPAAVSK